MIITNDKNFPRVIMKIDKFLDLEVKTLINEIQLLDKRAKKNNTFINYYIDLYYLKDYTFMCLTQFVSFIIKQEDPLHINKVIIYLDEMKDNSNIFMVYEQYKDTIAIQIEMIEIEEPIKIK